MRAEVQLSLVPCKGEVLIIRACTDRCGRLGMEITPEFMQGSCPWRRQRAVGSACPPVCYTAAAGHLAFYCLIYYWLTRYRVAVTFEIR